MDTKVDLIQLSEQIMKEKGLEPDFTDDEMRQAAELNAPAPAPSNCVDLRSLLWCSIDNDDSHDLDQLTYAEKSADKTTLWIAIADVGALVKKNSPIDKHAQMNTTSVYTPAKVFPMLPEKLSTNLTSLNENEDRLAMVVKVEMNQNGELGTSSIFEAMVHNYAQLAYKSVGAWLQGTGPMPQKLEKQPNLADNLKLQNEAAQALRNKRHQAGSLTLESTKTEVKIEDDNQVVMEMDQHNLANQLIEEFMIAANRTIANYFSVHEIASLRRVVRVPKNWDRIVEVAREYGETLPAVPNSKKLDEFLIKRQKADPVSFPDLSLIIIKLLGRGEYIVENYKDSPVGHFGLALSDYTHFTAPNRRFPDLISQRQFKAIIRNEQPPYAVAELYSLADHCTQQEDAATKVERRLNKTAAAMYMANQIGTIFKGIITGVNEKGTWVRIFQPSLEGKIVLDGQNLGVGDRVNVQLKRVDVLNGFIDFAVVKT